ncbi:MAG: type II CAAX endopeptidase family protein [Anaerovoracaceae bacterium]
METKKNLVNQLAFGLFLGVVATAAGARIIVNVIPNQTGILLAQLAIILVLPVTFVVAKSVPQTRLEKHPMDPMTVIKWILVGIAGTFAFNFLGHHLATIVSAIAGKGPVESTVATALTNMPKWYILGVVVFLGPIIEELIFRQVILTRLMVYGKRGAILISSLMFALYHGNIEQLFYTFFMGAILAIVMSKTGNLIYPIIIHVFLNFWGGFLPMILKDVQIFPTIILITVAIGIAQILKLRSLIGDTEDIYGLETIALRRSILNVGMILLIGYFIVKNYFIYF